MHDLTINFDIWVEIQVTPEFEFLIVRCIQQEGTSKKIIVSQWWTGNIENALQLADLMRSNKNA